MRLWNGASAGLAIAGIALGATACAQEQGGDAHPEGRGTAVAAGASAARGVCARNSIPGARSDVVVLVAVFKDGRTANFLCDVGYGPAAAGRPQEQPENFRPVGLTPGPLVALPAYQKWQDQKGDPCILLTSGGQKRYYCW